MSVKDGAAHLARLDRDRSVHLDGGLAPQFAEHPAFVSFCISNAC